MADGFEDFFYTTQDGLRLHARLYGMEHKALPVVCLPGLTRNVRDFHDLALALSTQAPVPHPVIAFDYRGRGESAWAADAATYTVVTEAEDILAGLSALGVAHAAFIGTSRGGLIIMVLAAMRPAVLKAAVLNDIGPRLEIEGLAQIQAYLARMPQARDWDEALALVKAANGETFTALTESDWRRLAGVIFREKDGRLMLDYDPALAQGFAALDLSQPASELWPQFDGLRNIPLMAIRGANSRLLSARTLAEMGERHPGMAAVTVDGQGHAPLLETAGLPEKIAAFLATPSLSSSRTAEGRSGIHA